MARSYAIQDRSRDERIDVSNQKPNIIYKILICWNIRQNSDSHRAWCTQTTFAEDGGAIMSPYDNFQHFVKSLLLLILFLLRQLPDNYAVRVDTQKFLDSVSMQIDGKRVCAGSWPLGPGWRNPNASPTQTSTDELVDNTTEHALRSDAIKRYAAYYEKVAQFIPYIVISKRNLFRPYTEHNNDGVEQTESRILGRPEGGLQSCKPCN